MHELASCYGTSVLPARPRTPRDKATAESSVQVVTRWPGTERVDVSLHAFFDGQLSFPYG